MPIERASDDLTATWGPRIRDVILPLNRLIGETLGSGDLLAYGYIAEVVARLMIESCEIARGIQEQLHKNTGTLH